MAIDLSMLLLTIHVSTVVLSISGFVYRGILLFSGSPRIHHKWIRIVPHVIDTLLLLSAIALAWQRGYNPLEHGWLATKLVAVTVYIGLGFVVFRFGRTNRQRMIAWVSAILVFAYIVGLAVTKQVDLGLLS